MGYYAQLTFGNQKRVDILVLNPENNKMIQIEVKSKQKTDFPFCKGIKGDNSFLVFVDFENKKLNGQPDFYILNEKNWIDLVEDRIQEFPDKKITRNQDNCPIWTHKSTGTPHSGMRITHENINAYESWDIIKNALK